MYDTNFIPPLPQERPNLDDEPRFTEIISARIDQRLEDIGEMDLSDFTGSGSRILWGYSNPLDFCLGFFFCSILRDFMHEYFQYYGINAEKPDYVWLRRIIVTKIPDMRKKLVVSLTNESLR